MSAIPTAFDPLGLAADVIYLDNLHVAPAAIKRYGEISLILSTSTNYSASLKIKNFRFVGAFFSQVGGFGSVSTAQTPSICLGRYQNYDMSVWLAGVDTHSYFAINSASTIELTVQSTDVSLRIDASTHHLSMQPWSNGSTSPNIRAGLGHEYDFERMWINDGENRIYDLVPAQKHGNLGFYDMVSKQFWAL